MTTVAADRALLHPADANLLRISLTYILPSLVVFLVILAGLWLLPDNYAGMYANYDGHWASWSARGILDWSGFLDFSPFSPLVGTGSLFAPNLPWFNPGALVLAMPASLPVRHLASMLVYLAELSASLYLLYRHLEFSREQSFLAALLYVCLCYIPFWSVTLVLPWYTLAPMNAHLIAAMNVATIALIRLQYEGLVSRLLFVVLFLAALFVAFASAPVSSVTYLPIYSVLWIAFLVPSRGEGRTVLWRCGAIAFALLGLGLIGAPSYLAGTAMMSARGDAMPPIFHPGWRLLSLEYWQELVSLFPVCQNHYQLMCPSAVVGWFEMAALAGAIILAVAGSGTKRRYGVVIVALLASIHLYALLSIQLVLGRLSTVSTPYLMWAFFPLAPPAAVAAVGAVVARLAGRRAAGSAWLPAAANWLVAAAAVFAWMHWIEPYLPPPPASASVGPPPIALVPARQGPIVDYLRQHIGLKPGGEFRGYAATYLGAEDGLVRKVTATPNDRMTYESYVAARDILFDRFGNRFQMMDLWNSDIPTFEEYGQWVSKQMHYFNRDLLAQKQDQVDPLQASILLYRFRPLLLRAMGVRFVIADGTLADPSVDRVMTETGKAGATIHLYEIKGANIGQFSPTQVTWTRDYTSAVAALQEQHDFENRVLLSFGWSGLVRASSSRLVAIRDGYRLTASAPGQALLVLPVQFSHCWEIESSGDDPPPRIVRANIVQMGILFKNHADARLRFNFQPWSAACRFEDASDLDLLGFK